VSDNRYSSAGICPIVISHSNSTKGTHIIAMITLTLDKHALVKASFSIYDSVSQVLRRSTPHQISRPRGFAPPRKGATIHYIVTGQGNTYQETLTPPPPRSDGRRL
jgi:hypothetical protein